MMERVRGDYWKTEENTFKVQIKTTQEQHHLQDALPGWQCVSYGYVPSTSEDIYVFERKFSSDNEWAKFLQSDNLMELIDMREVLND